MVNFTSLFTAAAAFACALAAPVEDDMRTQGKPIPGKYVVTLKGDLGAGAFDAHLKWVKGIHTSSAGDMNMKGVEKTYSGDYNFHGYAGSFDEATVAEIKKSSDVRKSGSCERY